MMFQVVLLLTVALGLVLTRLLALPRRALTGERHRDHTCIVCLG